MNDTEALALMSLLQRYFHEYPDACRMDKTAIDILEDLKGSMESNTANDKAVEIWEAIKWND